LCERLSIAVTARSPIERLVDFKQQRDFANLTFASDLSGEYTRTYVTSDDADVPGFSIFTRRLGVTRHFYSGEMSRTMADPGQDPRGGPDLDPLWLMLDLTPEGRGTDWYPKLEYGHPQPRDVSDSCFQKQNTWKGELGRSTPGQQLCEEIDNLPIPMHEASFNDPMALLAFLVEPPQMTLSMNPERYLAACNRFVILAAYRPSPPILA
jgi:hypothetical protein